MTEPTLQEWAERSVDMVPHIGQLTDLARDKHLIIEWGIRTGVSTLALLTGMPKDGRLIAVDVLSDVMDRVHPAVRRDPRVEFRFGHDLSFEYPADPDLVMIDTSHLYEDTKAELAFAAALGAKTIAFHDYFHRDDDSRVKEAVDEFLAEATYEWVALHESQWGLGVIKRVKR